MIWLRWIIIAYIAVTCIILARGAWKLKKDGDRETDNEDALFVFGAPFLWPLSYLALFLWKKFKVEKKYYEDIEPDDL